MADLHGFMTGKEILPGCRCQFTGNERSGRGDQAVTDHGDSLGRSPQHQAGKAPDFKPAHLGEDINGIRGVWFVKVQPFLDDGNFMGKGGIINARPWDGR